MQVLKRIGRYALVLVLVIVVILAVLMILGPIVGETFSSINSSLCGVGECPPATPISGQPSVQEALAEVDQALSQSMKGSFAYNSPSSMNLGDTVTIQLLLNPSLSPSQLGSQITESGVVRSGTLDVTPRMKAELIAQDPDAFVIQTIPENSEQLISNAISTKWIWFVTARKSGQQALTLVVYRLVRFEGQDYWREVESYKAHIDVTVTLGHRVQSIDWKWIVGILVTALLVPAFWRWIDSRNRKGKKQAHPKTWRKRS